jgi:hypothetical protein
VCVQRHTGSDCILMHTIDSMHIGHIDHLLPYKAGDMKCIELSHACSTAALVENNNMSWLIILCYSIVVLSDYAQMNLDCRKLFRLRRNLRKATWFHTSISSAMGSWRAVACMKISLPNIQCKLCTLIVTVPLA